MHAQLERAVIDRPATETVLLGDVARLRVHMIGIGGSGMSGAAALLRSMGATVSGSDVAPFDGLGALVAQGVRISIGHHESQLDDKARLVVVSAAIPEANPELAAARRQGMPVMKYAQLVGALTTLRQTIAIAGTHGKSTTTGMCVHLLRAAGLDPSFIIGARSSELGGSSGVGSGPNFVVESCEFDRSFHHLHPRSAAILNIEPDHMDCYASLDEIVEAFGEFAAKVAPDGLVVCNSDDLRSLEAARSGLARVETFGFDEGADWQASDLHGDRGRFSFNVLRQGRRILSTRLAIPGRHNVANALAATALAFDAGAPPDAIAEALRTFHGVDRRLMWKGEARGITIVDDYAHHPTEIRVTITAARARYNPQRLWVVFQPHQDSRTRYFMDQFATSFGEADEVIMPDVYLARDSVDASARPGSLELASRISDGGGKARYIPALGAVVERLVSEVAEGDLVLTMGAGDVWKVADELVERICGAGRVRCALGQRTWFRLGGRARYLFQPHDADQLSRLLTTAKQAEVPVRVLGRGANVLVSDDGFDGVVVRLDHANFRRTHRKATRLTVGGGVDLTRLVRYCCAKGLSGLEGMAGIPASVGGAIRMNAGGRFGEFGDVVDRVEVMRPDGGRETWTKQQCGFGYRCSAIGDYIVLAAELALREDDPVAVRKRFDEYFEIKQASQPLAEHSAGCIFKNPSGKSAGALIDQAGLKGTECGAARVSEKHANFIVAEKGATASDVLRLIDVVKERVRKEFDTNLEVEIDIWRPTHGAGRS